MRSRSAANWASASCRTARWDAASSPVRSSSAGELAADDWRRQNPRFQDGNIDRNQLLVQAVTELARERECTPAQLALAWLLHRGPDIVPIPGTRRIARLDENAAATRVDLTLDEQRRLDDVLATHGVAGTRYPAANMASVNA